MIAEALAAVALTRGPVAESVTPRSAIVSFRTSAPERAFVTLRNGARVDAIGPRPEQRRREVGEGAAGPAAARRRLAAEAVLHEPVAQVPGGPEEVGTLVVDIFDAKSKSLIFRGTASDEISEKLEKNQKKLAKASEKMFKDFPPGSAKK